MSYFSVRGTILQCFKDNIDQILWYILLNLTLWHLVNAGKAKTPLPQNLPSCGLHLLKELPTPQAVTLLCYLGHNNQSQLLLHSYQLTVNCSPPPPKKTHILLKIIKQMEHLHMVTIHLPILQCICCSIPIPFHKTEHKNTAEDQLSEMIFHLNRTS